MIRILIVLLAFSFSTEALAQPGQIKAPAEPVSQEEAELPAVETRTGNPLVEDIMRNANRNSGQNGPSQIPSLFFDNWELSLLDDAREGVVARAATDEELDGKGSGRKGPREISVGGIVYVSTADWTVWLNGQKITPERLPPEILDIQVSKQAVKLKWYDAYTNQIFPIKLKTYQRFNIDTRIFLPG